jgi:uncharacterized protein (DUF305 family)
MQIRILAFAAAVSVAAALPLAATAAEEMKMDHDMKSMNGEAKADTPAAAALAAANATMHRDMAIDYSGDADADFVKSMIPHHQGAIDMAKVELEYGKDPAIKSLAEGIIKAQEAEIAMMREWLKKNGQ